MKRWKATWIVLGLFCLLLAYVLLFEVGRDPPAPADATPTPSPVLDLEVGDLVAFHVTDGERTLRFERQGETWWVTEPGEGEADTYALTWRFSELARLEAKQVLLEEITDPVPYGLDPVALTVTLEPESGNAETLLIGRRTPDGSSFYVQLQGDPRLYLIATYKVEALTEWLEEPPYRPTPTPDAGEQ